SLQHNPSTCFKVQQLVKLRKPVVFLPFIDLLIVPGYDPIRFGKYPWHEVKCIRRWRVADNIVAVAEKDETMVGYDVMKEEERKKV
ncbi:hypothetical protein A2U01_0023090, partial [Trifolium medium]|nr:hypothetical protein [Trifolium medium]